MRESCESGPAVEESDCRVWGREVPYSVYVIELRRDVLEKKRFAAENPNCRAGKPCVYVGQTALTPDERFAQHLEGRKCNPFVRELGVRLRRRGYAVWSNFTHSVRTRSIPRTESTRSSAASSAMNLRSERPLTNCSKEWCHRPPGRTGGSRCRAWAPRYVAGLFMAPAYADLHGARQDDDDGARWTLVEWHVSASAHHARRCRGWSRVGQQTSLAR